VDCVGLIGIESASLESARKLQSMNAVTLLRARIPAIVLNHVDQLDYELALLVFLACIKRVLVFPAQCRLATFTVDVRDGMETRK